MSQSRRAETVKYGFDRMDELLTDLSEGPSSFLEKQAELAVVADHFASGIEFLSHASVPDFDHKHKLYGCYALLCPDINQLDLKKLKTAQKKLASSDFHAANSVSNIITALELRLHSESQTLNIHSNEYLNLTKIDLAGITITDKNCPHACMEEASIDNGFLTNFDIKHGNLRFLSARGTSWDGVDIAGADLHGINLANTDSKKTTLNNVSFFTIEEMQDKTKFKQALDRWYNMFTKEHPSGDHWYHTLTLKQHPQLSMIREAMVADVNNKISQLDSPLQQVDAYNIAYGHPMFAKHRDITAVRGFLNLFTVFKAKDGSKQAEAVVPTKSQTSLQISPNSD